MADLQQSQCSHGAPAFASIGILDISDLPAELGTYLNDHYSCTYLCRDCTEVVRNTVAQLTEVTDASEAV